MIPVNAATEEEIEQSIIDGLAWLAEDQDDVDGSWGASDKTAQTCFALIKLQDRAYELEYESPFDPEYDYSDNVIAGWEYVFNNGIYKQTPLAIQVHGVNNDDPDTNGNGYGVYFASFGGHPTYTTGICLMALEASGTPGRLNDAGIDYDGDAVPDSFFDIAQDATDWLAFAQADGGSDEGGWDYNALDNQATNGWADNSNSGYAVLGLAAAEGFGCTVPAWVRTELNFWINTIQDPVDGDADDGGSWYESGWSWVNQLKTGNLIFQMTFYGDGPGDTRFDDAIDYIERHWQDMTNDPGWGYTLDPADYQAMYCLMKGLEYSGVDLIDTDGDTVSDNDWFNQEPTAVPSEDFASVLVAQQNPDGSWPTCNWGNPTLCTIWALLTLEKVTPPPPVIDLHVDIKPESCPNPLNKKSNGVIPVAILGTEDFDVMTIDPETIRLSLGEEGVAPLRWSWEDVATPFENFDVELCNCHDLNGDGYLDLTVKFKTQEVVDTLDLCQYSDDTIPFTITGNLIEEAGGIAFMGQDCMWIR